MGVFQAYRGGRVVPAPSARCINTLSIQRPNFQPTPGILPTSVKPSARCRAIDAAFATSPITATISRSPRSLHASIRRDKRARPVPRPPAAAARPATQQALLFAIPFALLDRRALVVLLLAARQADLELDPAFAEVQIERRERVTRALDLADQAVDLRPVQQQLARARRVGAN